MTQTRDTESPNSDLSGRNGSRGRILKQPSGKNNLNLNIKGQANTSSRTAATTNMLNENNTNSSSQSHQQQLGGMHQLRSASMNSDKGLNYIGHDPANQLSQNDSCNMLPDENLLE